MTGKVLLPAKNSVLHKCDMYAKVAAFCGAVEPAL